MTNVSPNRLSSTLSPADAWTRAFDAHLIKSVIAFVGHMPMGGGAETHSEPESGSSSQFGWVPEVIKSLVKQARLNQNDFEWQSADEVALAEATEAFRGFFRGRFGIVHRPDEKLALRFTCYLSRDGMVWRPHQVWLDDILTSIGIIERFRYGDTGISRVAVPSLRSETTCVAYAIAILSENRWGLADRIRICPFAAHPHKGFHLSLDFRLRPSGEFERNAKYYCDPAHQNAHKQQEYRDRLKNANPVIMRKATRKHK